MKDVVHYLTGHPAEQGGLIYPTELDVESYAGFGSFYLLGPPGARVGDEYKFHAVQGEEIVETRLLRLEKSKVFYRVQVTDVGAFLFHAEQLARKPRYIGTEDQIRRLAILRRLRSWEPGKLDRACRKHAFYFVGYSPHVLSEPPNRVAPR